MDAGPIIGMVVFALAVSAAFGYLVARSAARKGYSKTGFWIFATFFLFPAAFLVGVLPERTPPPPSTERRSL